MDKQHLHGQMGDANYFVSTIVQSQNLVNAVHYDIDDITQSIAIWTELNTGKAKEWYFVIP